MAKFQADSESSTLVPAKLWGTGWFTQLPPKTKCLLYFVIENANVAGIWTPDYNYASLIIGEHVSEDDFKTVPTEEFYVLKNGNIRVVKYLIMTYCSFEKISQKNLDKIQKIADKEGFIAHFPPKSKTAKGEEYPSFSSYREMLKDARNVIISNYSTIQQLEKFRPGVDITKSMDKAIAEFWGTEGGYAYAKKRNYREFGKMLINAVDRNKVYLQRGGSTGRMQSAGQPGVGSASDSLEAATTASQYSFFGGRS